MVLLLAVAACLLDDNTGRIMYIVYVEVEVHRIRGRGCGGRGEAEDGEGGEEGSAVYSFGWGSTCWC